MSAEITDIVRRIEAAIREGSHPRMITAVEELLEVEPSEAPLVLWRKFAAVEDLYFRRVFSYAVAKTAAQQHRLLWGPLVSLMVSPYPDDESTLVNSLSALQLYEGHDDISAAILAPEFGAFSQHCAQAGTGSADALIELLASLAERRVLPTLLSRSQVRTLREFLERPDALPVLDPNRFSEGFPDGRQRLRAEAASVSGNARELGNGLTRLLLGRIESAVQSYDAREQAASADGVVEEIALSGSDTGRGRLHVETFERLIHSWRSAVHEGVKSVTTAAQPTLQTYVLTPARGSFILRFLVHADQLEPVTAVFEKVAEMTEDPERLIPASDLSHETKQHVLQFLEVLSQKRLNATLSHTDAKAFRRPGRRVTGSRLGPAVRNLRRTEDTVETHSVTGVLEGASHRQGTFEIRCEEFGELKGTVPQAVRGQLLNKAIGRSYVFELHERISLAGAGDTRRHWTLASVGQTTEAIVLQQAEAPELAEELISADVPQQDRLDRIVTVVRLVADGVDLHPTRLGMDDTASSLRHVDYMRHGAKVLALLAQDGSITQQGAQLARLPDSRVLDFLSVQFELSAVGGLWKRWANATDLYQLEPTTAETFLLEHGLSASMAKRRGRTLRRWLEKFKRRPAEEPLDQA